MTLLPSPISIYSSLHQDKAWIFVSVSAMSLISWFYSSFALSYTRIPNPVMPDLKAQTHISSGRAAKKTCSSWSGLFAHVVLILSSLPHGYSWPFFALVCSCDREWALDSTALGGLGMLGCSGTACAWSAGDRLHFCKPGNSYQFHGAAASRRARRRVWAGEPFWAAQRLLVAWNYALANRCHIHPMGH